MYIITLPINFYVASDVQSNITSYDSMRHYCALSHGDKNILFQCRMCKNLSQKCLYFPYF